MIEYQGRTVPVRPKTFALLLLLLEHPQEVLSKQYLLNSVWDDVVVDEQVLFQSIREIRQLFNGPDVIKNIPRKGYSWSAEVQKQPLKTSKNPVRLLTRFSLRPLYVLPAAAFLILGFTLYAFIRTVPPSPQGPVMVLPVKTQVPGNDHSWVYLGAMDQLITLLSADHQAVVMNTEYVLSAMRHAEMPRDYTSAQVARIFDVSGGALIVESMLSGTIEDYRLDYKLHFKNDVKRGVLFAQTVNALLTQLGSTVAGYTGQELYNAELDRHSEFASELMSRALEYMDSDDLDRARSLLESLTQLEAENLTAYRMLAQVMIWQGAAALAEKELTAVIHKNTGSGSGRATEESARLHYWLAIAQLKQGHNESALLTLDRADSLARDHHDWLYQAYVAELRGQTLEQLEQSDDAYAAYLDALKFHGVIRCPIGMAQTQLQIANLLVERGEEGEAHDYYSEAVSVIKKNKLDILKPLVDKHRLTQDVR